MTETPFKLYPRGFLGAQLEGRIEKNTEMHETGLGWRFASATVVRNQNDVGQANSAVETLYSQYINRAPNHNSFEFKKTVLKVALQAFGTPMFDFWFQMQFKSPAAGETHRRFLDDTLRFICTGRRDVALETWSALLSGDEEKITAGNMSDYAKEFFGIYNEGRHSTPTNRALTEVIQQWCSRPNGLEDLLCTLHLLFGTD